MDFRISEEHSRLQQRCRELAADFATRSAEHDRAASHPTENYQRLRDEGFLDLNIPKEWGGAGVGLLGHTLAFEALGAGCPSTALAFNMHASVVMPLLESPVTLIEAFDGHRWDSPQKLGSHRTHRWREMDSKPSVPRQKDV